MFKEKEYFIFAEHFLTLSRTYQPQTHEPFFIFVDNRYFSFAVGCERMKPSPIVSITSAQGRIDIFDEKIKKAGNTYGLQTLIHALLRENIVDMFRSQTLQLVEEDLVRNHHYTPLSTHRALQPPMEDKTYKTFTNHMHELIEEYHDYKMLYLTFGDEHFAEKADNLLMELTEADQRGKQ